jgi:hypothetical protein
MTIDLNCTALFTAFKRTHPEAPDISPIISCEIIYSSRKSLAIQIEKDARITVRAPFHASQSAIQAFLSDHQQWVFTHYMEQLRRLSNATSANNTAHIFQDGDVLHFYDQLLTLKIRQVPPCNHSSIYKKGDFLIIDTPVDTPQVRSACIARWYRENGKPVFTRRADYWASLMHVTYQNITIKEQKTRWGSCSSLGNLNFNWKLLLMEPRLLDYVVVHELAHRLEMNHSAAFWQIVETYIPDYKDCKKAFPRI